MSLPDDPDVPGLSEEDLRQALGAVIGAFDSDPTRSARELHDQLARMPIRSWGGHEDLHAAVPLMSQRTLADAARWMIRHGTSRRAVPSALGLLHG